MSSASSGSSQQKIQTKQTRIYKKNQGKTGGDSDTQNDIDNSQTVEETADEQLVQSTLIGIQDLFRKHHTEYLIAVGELIAKNFFAGDGERMRAKKPVLEKSFNMLCEKLMDADSKLPKKTWLYSAVKVCVDRAYLFENHEKDLFQTYEKLSPSSKVEVARIKDDRRLVEFLTGEDAKEIEKLSVRKLRDNISIILTGQPRKKTTVRFSQKTNSISKQVQKWKKQISASIEEGPSEQKKKFKELNSVLDSVLKQLEGLA